MTNCEDRTIVVENVALAAEESDLRDFFSFCGGIENIKIENCPDGRSQTAHVTFEDVESVGTAVLLSDAIIAEAPISIRPLTDGIVDASAAGVGARHQSTANVSSHSSQPSATDVVMKMIAVGYINGDNLIREVKQRAIKFDEENGVTVRTKEVTNNALTWAQQQAETFDHQYHWKQKAAFASFAFEKALTTGSSVVSRGLQAWWNSSKNHTNETTPQDSNTETEKRSPECEVTECEEKRVV